MPIYINNFNWLTPVRALVDFFCGIPRTEVIILDNKSTYPPLLEWYAKCKQRVLYLDDNYGEYAPWTSGAVLPAHEHRAEYSSDYYVVTDPDLSLATCPGDVLNILLQGSQKYPSVTKVGVSLEIDDIPSTSPLFSNVTSWEKQFWTHRRDNRFFDADVDTTLALYHVDVPFSRARTTGNSLRSDRPYTARHLPWYIELATMTAEERYYITSTSKGHWGRFLQSLLQQKSSCELDTENGMLS
jgi:hypothetical protein